MSDVHGPSSQRAGIKTSNAASSKKGKGKTKEEDLMDENCDDQSTKYDSAEWDKLADEEAAVDARGFDLAPPQNLSEDLDGLIAQLEDKTSSCARSMVFQSRLARILGGFRSIKCLKMSATKRKDWIMVVDTTTTSFGTFREAVRPRLCKSIPMYAPTSTSTITPNRLCTIISQFCTYTGGNHNGKVHSRFLERCSQPQVSEHLVT